MNMKRRPKLRPALWDGAVAAVILALAAGSAAWTWAGQEGGETAVVSAGNEEIDRFVLAESAGDRTYAVNGYTLTVRVSAGGVCVAEADCPTQDCVHTGVISRSGQSIVCLPGRFILRLEGGTAPDGGVDAVIG